ncbi:MAG: putative bifunctional diguanylate cyclase/phosphodiesterase, partial [Anaerolineales bacterium]
LDLDLFKVVNDSLGHSCGDQLLIAVAQRLRETLRSSDTIARFGGDEFAILLEDMADEACSRNLAERIQQEIRRPFMLDEHEVYMTASIGIAADTIKYGRPEDMLRDADLAMYQAKALGKGRSELFRIELRDQAFSRMQMEDELRRALDSREFQLYYQPITSLETERVVGLEALLRWSHPTRGLLLPADFLTVAEESSLILPIGAWVLNEACQQLKRWQDQHAYLKNVTVNVNISDKEFSQPNLVETVAKALSSSGLKGTSLRVEITERVLVDNFATANLVIQSLQSMGVQVQMDDFGTGYSALAYLQRFPINAIKIDRTFISEMGNDPKGLGLVRAIVLMGIELGMETIAEGIETKQQSDVLKTLSCEFGQGYLLSLPLDAAAAEGVLVKLKK